MMRLFYLFLLCSGSFGLLAQNAPTTAAPTPDLAAEDVISLYSDAYETVPVNTYRTDWSAAALAEEMIEGNNVLHYSSLDFAGMETTGDNALDLSEMTNVRFDLWTPNSTDFGFKMVDFGMDGFDGGNDTEVEIRLTPTQGEWTTIDLSLDRFSGMNLTDVSQYIISSVPSGSSEVWMDNILFYDSGEDGGGGGEEMRDQLDLPITFEDTSDVDYGFQDFAGAVSSIITDPTDAANTVAQFIKTTGAEVFAGTVLTSTDGPRGFATAIPFTEDASVLTVRVWSPAAGVPVRVKVENAADGSVSVETEDTTTVAMQWETLTFEFKNNVAGTPAINYDAVYNTFVIFMDFGTVGTEDVTYYWDDVVFTGTTTTGGGNEGMMPSVGAPAPAAPADSVLSLFSDAYDDVLVDSWSREFSNAQFSDVTIDGNPTKQYAALGFAVAETTTNPVDASDYDFLHIDYWTADIDTFLVKLVDFGMDGFDNGTDTEVELAFPTTQGEWVSLDIPMSRFAAGMNLTDINQYIFSARPFAAGTIWLDNVYFFRDAGRISATPRVELGVLSAYPNPAGEQFVVTAPVRMDDLTVIDAAGRSVARFFPASEQFTVPTVDMVPGVYTVLATAEDRRFAVRLVVR